MARGLAITAAVSLATLVSAQQIGTTPEVHPSLTTYKCTTAGGCVQQSTTIVLDWSYRWIHQNGTSNSCTTSSGVNTTLCGTEAECFQNCVIEAANYTSAGVATSGTSLTLHQYVTSDGVTNNESPRVYLLGPDGEDYDMLQLLGQEISFDVDGSSLVCGENGALYLSEMNASGGRSQYNPGGAAYGSGYCDAQCGVPTWINGSVNTAGLGACCNEMDLWEANAYATAYTPHPCSVDSIYECSGTACGSSGVCDKNGCGFNPFAEGATGYYGPGLTVDTSKTVTVTTQFITNDGTTSGTLSEIRRLYVQDGKVIANAASSTGMDSITASWCTSADSAAATIGGLTTMGEALGRGMVLIFSIWNDAGGYMNWLDSGSSGPCNATAGIPSTIEAQHPGTSVTFSNIKWGDINSTYTGSSTGSGSGSSSSVTKSAASSTTLKSVTSTEKVGTTSTPAASSTSSASSPAQSHYGQCGGTGWTGATACASPYTCSVLNAYYSQCV